MDLARLFGYVIERSEVKRVDEFDNMTAEELRAYLAQELELDLAKDDPPTKH